MKFLSENGMAKLVLVLLLLAPLQANAAEELEEKDLVIGRMKVSILSEYESPGVLVIQEGKFADRTAFPAKVKFMLPMGVEKLTDACSLSPGGQHFCQLYDIESDGAAKYVKVGLPYSDFFIDYKYTPFPIKENSGREFTYKVESVYDMQTLEVHIQKPYRAMDFAISPKSGDTYAKDDFEYFKYVFNDVKAGDIKAFKIVYFKEDSHPSVDIKYTGMTQKSVFEKNTGEILLGAGVVILGIVFFMRMRKKKAAS